MRTLTEADLIALQTGQSCVNTGGNRQVVERVVVDNGHEENKDCCTNGPTRAFPIDANKFGLGCQDIAFRLVTVEATIFRVGGPGWFAGVAAALGLTPGSESLAASTSDFGFGATANAASLNIGWDFIQSGGVLVNGLEIDVIAGTNPTVHLRRIDDQLGNCRPQVIKALCPPCPQSDTTTLAFDFCRLLNRKNFIEISVPAATTIDVRLNVGAFADAPNLVKCGDK